MACMRHLLRVGKLCQPVSEVCSRSSRGEAVEFFPNENRDGGELHGNLILLGVAGPVVLDVTINKRAEYPFGHRKETLGVSAATILDRSQWGMTYGVANNMVGDLVNLRFEFEAIHR